MNEESPLAERHMGFFVMNSTNDELVKSHIPYVVHASTKPVLSEPFVPSRASGRTVSRRACAERTVYPSTVRQAHGSGRTVFPNVLSEVEGSTHASASSAERNIIRLHRSP